MGANMNTQLDWADELALEIIADVKRTKYIDWASLPDIIAARLRLIRHEGERVGIETCRKALLTEEIVHDAHKPVLRPMLEGCRLLLDKLETPPCAAAE